MKLYIVSALMILAYVVAQNPLEINGGSCMAMVGKGCVAIAADKRFGVGFGLVSSDAKRILKLSSNLLCGFTGLTTDVQTLMQDLASKVASDAITDRTALSPARVAALLSAMLYSRRRSPLMVESIVAGLNKGKAGMDGKSYLRVMDMLGASGDPGGFAVIGTSSQSLYGTCETFFKEDMSPDELIDTVSRCLTAALERDCLSGNGAVVHMLTEDGMITRELQCRED